MKAITIWQPWATLIARGYKHFETRSWGTAYRGPIAIHAAKREPQPWDWEAVAELWAHGITDFPLRATEYPLGVVVAVAQLAGCERMTPALIAGQCALERVLGHWEPGRFAWRLEDAAPLARPVPTRGRQGLWDWTQSRP